MDLLHHGRPPVPATPGPTIVRSHHILRKRDAWAKLQPIDTKHLKTDRPAPDAKESDQAKQILDVLNLLKPLTDFHRAVEDATQNDLRLFWDVRLLRGGNIPFCHVHGSSSLPSLLNYNMLAEAPAKIEVEATNKIVIPLLSFMQLEVSKMLFPNQAEREPTDSYVSEDVCFDDGSDDVIEKPAPEPFDGNLH